MAPPAGKVVGLVIALRSKALCSSSSAVRCKVAIKSQHHVAAGHGLFRPIGRQDSPATVGLFNGHAVAAAQHGLVLAFHACPSDLIVGKIPWFAVAPLGQLRSVHRAKVSDDMRGQRAVRDRSAAQVQRSSCRILVGVGVDLRHDHRRNVVGHHVMGQFFGHDDSRRRRVFQQQSADAGGPCVVVIVRRRLSPAVGLGGNAFHTRLNPSRASGPLLGRKTAKLGQALGQRGAIRQHARLRCGSLLRIFTLGFGQPCPGGGPKPTCVGRLSQPAIIDRHGLNRVVASQDVAVTGEDAAARRRQRGLLFDRPKRHGAKTGPLRQLQLNAPARTPPATPPRIPPDKSAAAAVDRPPRGAGVRRRGIDASRRA